ncbi:hypothetical protein HZC32_02705, partial [Candidatus Woesearchaeota archaeon]|nr:hypothetical protein [Candidatus Woesearchaeota archaeon]
MGAGTDWCTTSGGGWCDYAPFKPKNCWMYQSGSTECNATSGCNWRTDSYSTSNCEINWSANCWQYNTNSSCSNASCWWRTDGSNSWCTNVMDKCWASSTSATCSEQTNANGNSICYWDTWGSYCQPLCFNGTYMATSAACQSVPGCTWKAQSGWCEEQGMGTSCSANANATACTATTG